MLPTMNSSCRTCAVRPADLPAGAQMVAFAPVSIAMNGLGLNVTGFSTTARCGLCGRVREMMPDRASSPTACARLQDLVAAADAGGRK